MGGNGVANNAGCCAAEWVASVAVSLSDIRKFAPSLAAIDVMTSQLPFLIEFRTESGILQGQWHKHCRKPGGDPARGQVAVLRRAVRLLAPRAVILEQTEGLRSHCVLAYREYLSMWDGLGYRVPFTVLNGLVAVAVAAASIIATTGTVALVPAQLVPLPLRRR